MNHHQPSYFIFGLFSLLTALRESPRERAGVEHTGCRSRWSWSEIQRERAGAGLRKQSSAGLYTQHQHVAISTDKRKPETVTYYNRTKVGVDVLDQMARQYSVKGGTRRWPVAVFYNLLDLAAINACVLYRSCIENNIPRRDFMLQLAQELRTEWMASKVAPHMIMPLDSADQLRRMTSMVKAQCKQNKTFAKCLKCRNAVCGKCTVRVMNVCPNCV
ncbi:uncharacterized protein LOC131537240 [Onychostoma macrolepis]|uniref:uncharacterized protein LOC131537240 n=1 Tax=Onychostoma macrolepis TaxID=369639 RepID=UPI00272D4294|nr:uncharacterized protein LOC131537240 [Onychostoma macrolepis]XP_058626545.1 uncharacterized protein LOC131537240 [Onychostoma macrolepis]